MSNCVAKMLQQIRARQTQFLRHPAGCCNFAMHTHGRVPILHDARARFSAGGERRLVCGVVH